LILLLLLLYFFPCSGACCCYCVSRLVDGNTPCSSAASVTALGTHTRADCRVQLVSVFVLVPVLVLMLVLVLVLGLVLVLVLMLVLALVLASTLFHFCTINIFFVVIALLHCYQWIQWIQWIADSKCMLRAGVASICWPCVGVGVGVGVECSF
jgi:hypothetical protein